MQAIPLAIAAATFVSTLFGGLFALRFRDRLHLILGFSAGAVIGVAFFDLLPEAISLGSAWSVSTITSIVALGFVIYLLLDRTVLLHAHDEESEQHEHRGTLGAGSLALHSFLDGTAIGLAFQASAAVGTVVAVAVLVHDFSDGINTVNMILKSGGDRARGLRWLVIDALAPVAGVLSTFFYHLGEGALAVILAIFCGFFIYIGASDLLPESHHRHGTFWTTAMTALGIAVLFIAIRAANL